jgi:hypothetical protein
LGTTPGTNEDGAVPPWFSNVCTIEISTFQGFFIFSGALLVPFCRKSAIRLEEVDAAHDRPMKHSRFLQL